MGILALGYSVVVYLMFFVTFLYLIVFVGGDALGFLGAPKTIDAGPSIFPAGPAALVDIGLLLLFGLQHSVMARPGFKRAWTKIVPKEMERSTYVLATVAVLILMFAGWRPIPAVVWSEQGSILSQALTILFILGFGIVLLATFLINHFELFGLQQGWHALRRREAAPPVFRTPLFYHMVRHPLYLGFLIAFWATPHMTAGHLLFAGVWTAYIFIAIGYEERDLVGVFGDKYREYMAKVPSIIPLGRRK